MADGPLTDKRILLIRNAYPYDFGGGERFPIHLAAALSGIGFAPTVVSHQQATLAYAESKNIPAIRGPWWAHQNFSGWRLLLCPFYFVWQLYLVAWYFRLIRRVHADIVHPQSKDDFIGATIAAKLLGKRVIWTDHADLKYVYANHTVWYKNPVGKLVFAVSRLADAVTLVSHSEKQLIEKAVGHPLSIKYMVIHNGVFDTPEKPVARPVADTAAIVFCATSRLVTAKGIGELIAAFTNLHSARADTRLWLLGDGPESAAFKEQASDTGGITFFGHRDDALSYVIAADIFVHPSYHEGFSLSLIEAAMLRKPIIACNVGGNSEIITDEENGLLVPARDSRALQMAMERLARDSELRQRFSVAARQTYVDEFDFEKIVTERFVPLYEKT